MKFDQEDQVSGPTSLGMLFNAQSWFLHRPHLLSFWAKSCGFVLVWSLLRKISRKKQKQKKEERKNKRKEEHIRNITVVRCLLPYSSLLLPIILVSFHSCFTHLFITIGVRNTYVPAVRTSTLGYNSTLLSITDLCTTYNYLLVCLPKIHIFLHISIDKDPCNLGATSS